MRRPAARCTTPGCPNTHHNTGRCDTCKARQPSPATWTRLYGPEWPRTRLEYLTRNPVCALCGHLANIPDHYPRSLKTLRRLGVDNPHADHRLRPLCDTCHKRETARHQPGGWRARQLE